MDPRLGNNIICHGMDSIAYGGDSLARGRNAGIPSCMGRLRAPVHDDALLGGTDRRDRKMQVGKGRAIDLKALFERRSTDREV